MSAKKNDPSAPTVCPKCRKPYKERPAMSRRNKTAICPECGLREAMDDAGISEKEQAEIIAEIQKKTAGK